MIKYIRLSTVLLAVLQGDDILKIFNTGFLSVVKNLMLTWNLPFLSKSYLSHRIGWSWWPDDQCNRLILTENRLDKKWARQGGELPPRLKPGWRNLSIFRQLGRIKCWVLWGFPYNIEQFGQFTKLVGQWEAEMRKSMIFFLGISSQSMKAGASIYQWRE